jgi:hypothetical protein
MLKKAAPESDKRLWDLLPVMYAAAFVTSNIWKEAQFKPYIEGIVSLVCYEEHF